MAEDDGGIFKDNSKKIQRLLKRATEQSIRAQKRQMRATGKIARELKANARAGERMARAFASAMRAGRAKTGGRISIRMTAPDTGGRSFHFDHTAVKPRASDAGGGSGGSRGRQATRGSAHMGYIERPDAIERPGGLERDNGRERERETAEEGNEDAAELAAARDKLRERLTRDPSKVRFEDSLDIAMPEAEGSKIAIPRRPAALAPDAGRNPHAVEEISCPEDVELGIRPMQDYVEREGAVEAARAGATAGSKSAAADPPADFSFGTIADTREGRLAFWDLVEEHGKGDSAVLQHRLILELPHEVSPEVRLSIVKSFTKRFEDEGIPYWAVLHAPTEKNDRRNYHAHIVHLTRPARIIMHPEGGDIAARVGPARLVPTWDFAAVSYVPDKHRVTRKRYPFRQKAVVRHKGKGRPYIEAERRRFAEVVNAELEKIKSPIRYDPRSYKAMGIDVDAIGSLSRKVLEQARSGKRTVEDSGLTARLMRQITERAARGRARALAKLDAEIAALPAPPVRRDGRLVAPRMGREQAAARRTEFARRAYRVAPGAAGTPEEILDFRHRELALRRRQAADRVAADVETAKLRHVVALTDPEHFLKVARNLKEAYQKRKASGRSKSGMATPDKVARDEAFRKKQLEGLPDFRSLQLLHKSAKRELADHLRETAARDGLASGRIANLASTARALRTTPSAASNEAYRAAIGRILHGRAREAANEAAERQRAAEAARRERAARQSAQLLGTWMKPSGGKRPIPMMPALNPMVEAFQRYVLETAKPDDPASYDRMYAGLRELAESFRQLRVRDPGNAAFRNDPVVARQYGIPERDAHRDAVIAARQTKSMPAASAKPDPLSEAPALITAPLARAVTVSGSTPATIDFVRPERATQNPTRPAPMNRPSQVKSSVAGRVLRNADREILGPLSDKSPTTDANATVSGNASSSPSVADGDRAEAAEKAIRERKRKRRKAVLAKKIGR